jgi:hypothetical protein
MVLIFYYIFMVLKLLSYLKGNFFRNNALRRLSALWERKNVRSELHFLQRNDVIYAGHVAFLRKLIRGGQGRQLFQSKQGA